MADSTAASSSTASSRLRGEDIRNHNDEDEEEEEDTNANASAKSPTPLAGSAGVLEPPSPSLRSEISHETVKHGNHQHQRRPPSPEDNENDDDDDDDDDDDKRNAEGSSTPSPLEMESTSPSVPQQQLREKERKPQQQLVQDAAKQPSEETIHESPAKRVVSQEKQTTDAAVSEKNPASFASEKSPPKAASVASKLPQPQQYTREQKKSQSLDSTQSAPIVTTRSVPPRTASGCSSVTVASTHTAPAQPPPAPAPPPQSTNLAPATARRFVVTPLNDQQKRAMQQHQQQQQQQANSQPKQQQQRQQQQQQSSTSGDTAASSMGTQGQQQQQGTPKQTTTTTEVSVPPPPQQQQPQSQSVTKQVEKEAPIPPTGAPQQDKSAPKQVGQKVSDQKMTQTQGASKQVGGQGVPNQTAALPKPAAPQQQQQQQQTVPKQDVPSQGTSQQTAPQQAAKVNQSQQQQQQNVQKQGVPSQKITQQPGTPQQGAKIQQPLLSAQPQDIQHQQKQTIVPPQVGLQPRPLSQQPSPQSSQQHVGNIVQQQKVQQPGSQQQALKPGQKVSQKSPQGTQQPKQAVASPFDPRQQQPQQQQKSGSISPKPMTQQPPKNSPRPSATFGAVTPSSVATANPPDGVLDPSMSVPPLTTTPPPSVVLATTPQGTTQPMVLQTAALMTPVMQQMTTTKSPDKAGEAVQTTTTYIGTAEAMPAYYGMMGATPIVPFQDKTHVVKKTKGRFRLLAEVPKPAGSEMGTTSGHSPQGMPVTASEGQQQAQQQPLSQRQQQLQQLPQQQQQLQQQVITMEPVPQSALPTVASAASLPATVKDTTTGGMPPQHSVSSPNIQTPAPAPTAPPVKETIAGGPHHSVSTPNFQSGGAATSTPTNQAATAQMPPAMMHSNSMPPFFSNKPSPAAPVPATATASPPVQKQTVAADPSSPRVQHTVSAKAPVAKQTPVAPVAGKAPAAKQTPAAGGSQQPPTHQPLPAAKQGQATKNAGREAPSNRGLQRSDSAASASTNQQPPPAQPVRKGRFVVTTVQDPMMPSQSLAFLVPTTQTTMSAPTGTINATTGQPERVVYNSAVVMTTGTPVMPQQVMYAAATPQGNPSVQPPPPMGAEKPLVGEPQPGQVRPPPIPAGSESGRDRQRPQGEQRLRNPAPPRKPNGEKGLGKAFYLLEQLKQETTDADRAIKNLQSDMRFMRDKNKELETKLRDTEKKLAEERTLREAAETKTKALRKTLREKGETAAASGGQAKSEGSPKGAGPVNLPSQQDNGIEHSSSHVSLSRASSTDSTDFGTKKPEENKQSQQIEEAFQRPQVRTDEIRSIAEPVLTPPRTRTASNPGTTPSGPTQQGQNAEKQGGRSSVSASPATRVTSASQNTPPSAATATATGTLTPPKTAGQVQQNSQSVGSTASAPSQAALQKAQMQHNSQTVGSTASAPPQTSAKTPQNANPANKTPVTPQNPFTQGVVPASGPLSTKPAQTASKTQSNQSNQSGGTLQKQSSTSLQKNPAATSTPANGQQPSQHSTGDTAANPPNDFPKPVPPHRVQSAGSYDPSDFDPLKPRSQLAQNENQPTQQSQVAPVFMMDQQAMTFPIVGLATTEMNNQLSYSSEPMLQFQQGVAQSYGSPYDQRQNSQAPEGYQDMHQMFLVPQHVDFGHPQMMTIQQPILQFQGQAFADQDNANWGNIPQQVQFQHQVPNAYFQQAPQQPQMYQQVQQPQVQQPQAQQPQAQQPHAQQPQVHQPQAQQPQVQQPHAQQPHAQQPQAQQPQAQPQQPMNRPPSNFDPLQQHNQHQDHAPQHGHRRQQSSGQPGDSAFVPASSSQHSQDKQGSDQFTRLA